MSDLWITTNAVIAACMIEYLSHMIQMMSQCFLLEYFQTHVIDIYFYL